ncbi:hypothetical protein KY285_019270 [Solanum tuberosum]|nr:hypothetical protein KY285_019270 [Solanum tuberosum]
MRQNELMKHQRCIFPLLPEIAAARHALLLPPVCAVAVAVAVERGGATCSVGRGWVARPATPVGDGWGVTAGRGWVGVERSERG